MTKFGNLDILEKLSETKYTEIYKVSLPREGKNAILKVLKNEYPTQELVSRLKSEFQILSRINSPYSIQAYSLEKEGNRLGILQEDIGGSSLKELFRGKLELSLFYKLAILMVNAIYDVHKNNVIHKDINPSNFIYNPKTEQLKIIDFGISSTFTKENTTLENPNVLEGTILYISPEQTGRMNRSIDYRTDFYSLGITFYEFLTGKPPFEMTDPIELVHSHIAKQPLPPNQVDSSIPKPLSDLVMKLISKTAEERYLSCAGLKYDLEILRSGVTEYTDIFPKLGTKDYSEKFQIPQKLYGRENEIQKLLSSFEKMHSGSENSKTQFLLVSGFSGIGKSSLVAEIYKPITEKRGFFISGKFDQFQRNIPYSAVVNAFRGLINQLLTENQENIQKWKSKLLESFDSKGKVIAEVIPEIELIVGEQPQIPELPPAESRNRFNMVFQNFIQVFCKEEHPLVIFLDDLQWADSATLKLIELLTTDKDLSYLFLIGAYRDNEVNATHPFIMALEEIKKNLVPVQELNLTPLQLKHIEEIVADTLHCQVSESKSIANLIEKKTGGNPFFVNEFLKTLYNEQLIWFDDSNIEKGKNFWKWDIEKIHSKSLTDNVVELLIGNMKKLSKESQGLLELAACIGNQFDIRTMSMISEIPEDDIFSVLLEPIQAGLISPPSKFSKDLVQMIFKFAHDRVQQAAYSLIDDSVKKEFHVKIGRLLLKHIHEKEQEERVFEIVNQLNAGLELIQNQEEKIQIAKLNLIAGLKAKHSNSEQTALKHCRIGLELLSKDSWVIDYDLSFKLHKETALLEYMAGNFDRGKALFVTSLANVTSKLDKAEIYSIEMNLYMTQGEFKTGIKSGLTALAVLGLRVPEDQAELSKLIAEETNTVEKGLKDRDISALSEMPNIVDEEKIAITQLLVDLWSLAYLDADYTLLSYNVLKLTSMSLQQGNTAFSAFGYAAHGLTLAGAGRYKEAFALGSLAIKLNEKFNNASLTGKINNLFCHAINPYNRHLKTNIPLYQASYHACMLCGDLTYGGWALFFIIWTRLEIGENLASVSETADQYLPSVQKNNDTNVTYVFQIVQRLMWNFLGRTSNVNGFTDEIIDEEKCLEFWKSNNFDHAINWYSYSKGQLLYLYDLPEESYKLLKSVEDKILSNIGFFPVTKHNFYFCLSITSIYNSKTPEEQIELLEKLQTYQNQMLKWAESGPENFLHKYKLIEAERLRITGNYFEAQKFYDEAIALANKSNFIQDEGIANELCAKFWLESGKRDFAEIYFKRALYAYSIWGAKRKSDLFEKKYSISIRSSESTSNYFSGGTIIPKSTIEKTTRMEANISLDFVSILKASQIISGEIILEKLLSALMKILVENAGAEKGFLLLEENKKLVIETSWNSEINQSNGKRIEFSEDNNLLSSSIVNYVTRTKLDLVIEDLSREGKFKDSYISQKKPKSVLCIPLLNQGKLVGIVYLENNLSSGAFTIDRIEILKMLSAQAAISIENARLYSNLENVTKEKTRVTTEMEIARDIQTSLLPKKPILTGFEVATYMHTAELVGGDYFDIIHTEGGEWFLIGDVSGHGVTAGLIMMMTQTAIHTILNSVNSNDPSELLRKVNKVITSNIHKMNLSKYMTLTLFLKDLDGTLYYSGMHQDLLVYSAKQKKVNIIETKGSWLGYYDLHNEYEVDTLKMESGDVLLLFTDGITEAINFNKETFELDRLIQILQNTGIESANKIKESILESLQSFKTDDDITFMVCKRI